MQKIWAQSKVQRRAKLPPHHPLSHEVCRYRGCRTLKDEPAAPISRSTMRSQSCRGLETHLIPVDLMLQLPEPQIKHGDIAYLGLLFPPKLCRIMVGAVTKPETGAGVLGKFVIVI